MQQVSCLWSTLSGLHAVAITLNDYCAIYTSVYYPCSTGTEGAKLRAVYYVSAAIGIYAGRMIDGSGSAPYIKGGGSVLLLCIALLALVNVYAKKGLFQESPATRSTQQPKR